MTRDRLNRPFVRLAAVFAAVALSAAAGCGDLTGLPASLPALPDSTLAYAINGAPPGAPTAMYLFSGAFVSADASYLFDVAFDFDSAGNVKLLPVSTVASGLATSHTVGLQIVNTPFDSLNRVPGSGYRADTALIVPVGATVAIQSTDPNACSFSLTGTALYGKLVVDAADPVARQLVVRFVSDPNCGFRSVVAGSVPKN